MYGQFLSPSAASVYLGPLHIDDCYAIKFSSEESSAPLYQYDQAHFSGVAPGKVLVSGNIAIPFRYPGYLTMAIKKAGDTYSSGAEWFQDRTMGQKDLVDWLSKMRSADAKTKFQLLADAARKGPDFLRQVSALAWLGPNSYSQLGTNGQQEIASPAEFQKNSLGGINLNTTIWIYYDELDGYPIADKLESVVFLGVAKSLSAAASPAGDVSASGVPIIEIYPFFAKRATQMILNPGGWQPTGPSDKS